jgi:hypothetical protein
VRIELLLGQQRVVVVPLQQGDHHVRRPLVTTTKRRTCEMRRRPSEGQERGARSYCWPRKKE